MIRRIYSLRARARELYTHETDPHRHVYMSRGTSARTNLQICKSSVYTYTYIYVYARKDAASLGIQFAREDTDIYNRMRIGNVLSRCVNAPIHTRSVLNIPAVFHEISASSNLGTLIRARA